MEKRDVIVIGAGIAGMTVSIYLKRFGLDVLLIEKGKAGGELNKIVNLENYPGFLDKKGSILAENIYEQIKELGIEYLNEIVTEITIDDKKVVKTSTKEYECNQIVIATGRTPRKLKIKGEEELLGQGISYCATCDGFFFKGKDVAVIGSSKTALDDIIYLSKLVNKCYLVTPKSALNGSEEMINSIKNLPNVEIMYNSSVREFCGDEVLTGIKINSEEKPLEVQGAFLSNGYEPNFFINSLSDLETKNNYLKVDNNYETNIKGVFAIGDAISKEIYQLTTAVSEAAIAASFIKKNYYR